MQMQTQMQTQTPIKTPLTPITLIIEPTQGRKSHIKKLKNNFQKMKKIANIIYNNNI